MFGMNFQGSSHNDENSPESSRWPNIFPSQYLPKSSVSSFFVTPCGFSQQPVQSGVIEVFYSIALPPLESFDDGGDRLVQLGAWLVVHVHPEPEKESIISKFVTFKEIHL